MPTPGVFIWESCSPGDLGTEVPSEVQGRSPGTESVARSPTETEAVCRHCLWSFTDFFYYSNDPSLQISAQLTLRFILDQSVSWLWGGRSDIHLAGAERQTQAWRYH